MSTLSLAGDEAVEELAGLASEKQLRWVVLPPKISQQQFAGFVTSHTDLVVLEMTDCAKVDTLAPLENLKGLQDIVLGGPYKDLAVLHGLKSLKFIGIAKGHWDESAAGIAALRAALPDAVVIRVSPLCLGSGWILLLLPVIAYVWIRRSRATRLARAA